jgi:hypothetical protein
MPTRHQEKAVRKQQQIDSIKERARSRNIGQAMKDNGRWYNHKDYRDNMSYTRREQKQLKMK